MSQREHHAGHTNGRKERDRGWTWFVLSFEASKLVDLGGVASGQPSSPRFSMQLPFWTVGLALHSCFSLLCCLYSLIISIPCEFTVLGGAEYGITDATSFWNQRTIHRHLNSFAVINLSPGPSWRLCKPKSDSFSLDMAFSSSPFTQINTDASSSTFMRCKYITW